MHTIVKSELERDARLISRGRRLREESLVPIMVGDIMPVLVPPIDFKHLFPALRKVFGDTLVEIGTTVDPVPEICTMSGRLIPLRKARLVVDILIKEGAMITSMTVKDGMVISINQTVGEA